MENQTQERSTAELVNQYAGLLWHWAWLLILVAVVAGGSAYVISRRQPPTYEASTLLIINGAPGSTSESYSSFYISQQLAPTYAQVMTTRPILDATAARLGLPAFPGVVQVVPITETQLMRVTITDTDPERAALLANTLVSVFTDQLQDDQASRYLDSKTNLETQMAAISQNIQDTTVSIYTLDQQIQDANNELTTVNLRIQRAITYPGTVDAETAAADISTRDQLQASITQNESERAQLQVTQTQYQQSYYYLLQSYESVKLAEAQSTASILQKDPAIANSNPIRPQPIRSAIISAMIGLMLAAGLIFLIEFLDDTIRDPQEITRTWGVPVLGTITRFDTGKANYRLITQSHPRAPVSEAFRSLRTNLQFASVTKPLHTIIITSASPGEGKTTIAANLGTVLAQSNRSVVIVDADLRRPTIHKAFELPNRLGLTDIFIRSSEHLDGTVKPTKVKDLSVITSGSLPPNPSELLGSKKMGEILGKLNAEFNTVILDTPPLLAVTDPLVLAPRSDGIVLIFKPTVTKRAALRHAIELVQRVNGNLLGIVVNDVKIDRTSYYYYRGYSYSKKYGKGYHDTEETVPGLLAGEPGKPDGNTDTSVDSELSGLEEKLKKVKKNLIQKA
jgi:polysaccharide biosynthesis transport protein